MFKYLITIVRSGYVNNKSLLYIRDALFYVILPILLWLLLFMHGAVSSLLDRATGCKSCLRSPSLGTGVLADNRSDDGDDKYVLRHGTVYKAFVKIL